LENSEPAQKLLTDLGYDLGYKLVYDPVYGARTLKRTIEREVMDSLALKILEGEFREGYTIRIDSEDGTFRFTSN
jgi:ATP-dependent Clp protease ATP-binding subunit ClpA